MPRLVPLPHRPAPSSQPEVVLDLQQAWGLYDRQARFVGSDALFSLFLGGVGSGKSHALTAWVLRRALANPNSDGALLGRTSVDLQTVLLPSLFDRLDEIQEQCGVSLVKDYDKGNARLTLCNDARIWFRPYNRIAKLRGLTLTFGAADEVEWSEAEPEEVWSVLTGRLRGRGSLPGLAFATSPNGLRGITRKFVEAQRHYLDAEKKGDLDAMRTWSSYYTTTATSFANPFLPAHFFDSLKSMSKRRYQQEVEGRVLTPTNTVWTLEPRHIVPWRWQDHRGLPRAYGVDWGGQEHHVSIMFQVDPATGRWVAADELVADDCPRGQFVDRLIRWIDSHGSTPPAMIGVDRACPVENQHLQRHYRHTQIAWMHTKEEQKVVQGVEMVRDALDPLSGEPLLLFSNGLSQVTTGATAPLIPAMRGYCYHLDASGLPTAKPKKDNVHDHMCDSLRMAWVGSANRRDLHGGRVLWTPPAAGDNSHADVAGRSDRHVA